MGYHVCSGPWAFSCILVAFSLLNLIIWPMQLATNKNVIGSIVNYTANITIIFWKSKQISIFFENPIKWVSLIDCQPYLINIKQKYCFLKINRYICSNSTCSASWKDFLWRKVLLKLSSFSKFLAKICNSTKMTSIAPHIWHISAL